MINRNISVHLQDFPGVNFVKDDQDLVKNMDLVRLICSTALSIRDQKNLRVRLPLNKLTIIGKNLSQIDNFKEIIADEVNVKNIEIQENLDEFADLNLKINFKKIGSKLGPKIKEIMAAAKSQNFNQISENEIEIADIKLIDDDFELALTPKKDKISENEVIISLPDNSSLIALDIELTEELENEGIARDIIRAVQQARKDADLDVSDKIELQILADNKITKPAEIFENYIKEQVLAQNLKISYDQEKLKSQSEFSCDAKIEEQNISIGINKVRN